MKQSHPWKWAASFMLMAFVGYAACTGERDAQSGDAGANNGSGGVAGSASPADAGTDATEDLGGWRPVPGGIQDLPITDAEQCGPGCRLLLGGYVSHPAAYSHSHDDPLVADGDVTHIYVGDTKKKTSSIVARATSPAGLLGPSVYGHRVAYARMQGTDGWVEVVDLDTKQVRTFSHSTRVDTAADLGILHVGLNDKYVFWMKDHEGLFRADLASGEIRRLNSTSDECDRFCTTNQGLVCGSVAAVRVMHIDQDTGVSKPLSEGGSLQVDARCSNDRKRVVWVDYRDAPTQSLSYDTFLSGGEIYMYDLETGDTARVSHDSPAQPHGKIRPSVDGNRVVWLEQSEALDPNPTSPQQLYLGSTVVLHDIGTGRRCRLENSPLQSRVSLHGTDLYGYWDNPVDGHLWLAAIDLTNPSYVWKCDDGLPPFPTLH